MKQRTFRFGTRRSSEPRTRAAKRRHDLSTSSGELAALPKHGVQATKRERRSSRVPHTTRPDLHGAAHVVLRIQRGLPWLRTPKTYRVLERAFRRGREKKDFRLIEYSVQRDQCVQKG